jgi:3-(methylthio)propionyl---CoA ligase
LRPQELKPATFRLFLTAAEQRSVGEVQVRGLWVCSDYYRADWSQAHDVEGWFATEDVGTIDPDGYLQITDRRRT